MIKNLRAKLGLFLCCFIFKHNSKMENKIKPIELLEVDKADTEIIIQKLHTTTTELEKLRDKQNCSLNTEKLNSFIKEMEKEIEFNEDILKDFDDSIKFIEGRL